MVGTSGLAAVMRPFGREVLRDDGSSDGEHRPCGQRLRCARATPRRRRAPGRGARYEALVAEARASGVCAVVHDVSLVAGDGLQDRYVASTTSSRPRSSTPPRAHEEDGPSTPLPEPGRLDDDRRHPIPLAPRLTCPAGSVRAIRRPEACLREHLQSASPDLLRDMVTTFLDALMSAQADATCGPSCAHQQPRLSNVRNGSRPWDFDTRYLLGASTRLDGDARRDPVKHMPPRRLTAAVARRRRAAARLICATC